VVDKEGVTELARAAAPLAGVRVLDCMTGPMAAVGRQFAELGADVIRVEPRDGAADRREGTIVDGTSLDFVAANLGKRSAALDLGNADDRRRFEALAADADILIEPGSPEIQAESLRRQYPHLVILTITDFGLKSPLRSWRGSGPVFHALSGELSRSGIAGREPLLPPGDLAHACAATQAGFVALLAYLHRLSTGLGDRLDFSILDGATQALDPGYGIAGSATAGVPASKLPRGRAEARHQYPIIACKDGFVRLCILAPRQWRGMFEWMGRPEEFADPSYDRIHTRFTSPTLLPAIARFFAGRTREELETEGQRYGVPTAAVLDVGEVLATDHIQTRQALASVPVAPGMWASFPNGVTEIDGVRMGIPAPAPALGGAEGWAERPALPDCSEHGERPLSGLKVLDLGVIVVGAEQGRLLADQGADVIKVENADFPDGSRQNVTGGPISVTFAAGHRNKRGLGLNLRDPKGKALLLDLVRDSDVLLSNFRAGTLESLGLDYATLKQINPGIIVVDSSAFGPTGPWSRRLGYGPLVRASAGLTMQWSYPGEPGSFSDAITVYPDHAAARIGLIGVLSLLIRRMRTGAGGTVSISQAEVMLSQMAPDIARQTLTGEKAPVTEQRAQTSGVYACAGDDEWCVVTIRDEQDQRALDQATGGVPLADWLAQRAPGEAMAALQTAGIAAAAMLRVAELPDFEHWKARDFFRSVKHPHIPEPFFLEVAPVLSERLPDPPERPAPLLGEHSEEILRERLKLGQAEIEALAADQVIDLAHKKENAAV
jgi:crotonobetainyl-CoA:carnitine CoA-transferase CaiB-like acyl-CoA transferase